MAVRGVVVEQAALGVCKCRNPAVSQFVVQQQKRGGEGRSGVIAATAASTIHDTGLASR